MNIIKFFTTILLFLVITLSCTQLVIFHDGFYQSQFAYNQVYQQIPFNRVQDQYTNLFSYFKDKETLNDVYYSEKEALHLKDVKTIIKTIKITNLVSITALLFLLLIYFKKFGHRNIIDLLFKSSLAILLSYLIILLTISLVSFEKIFYQMHTIIFKNNFWLLDPTSELLIVIFPPALFFNILATILICCIIFSVFIIAILKRLNSIK